MTQRSALAAPAPKLRVREIQINDIMRGTHVEMQASARILGAQTRYGNVYLFVEEDVMNPKVTPSEPTLVRRYLKGFRASSFASGAGIELEGAVFRCAVLEADKDHALIYEGAE